MGSSGPASRASKGATAADLQKDPAANTVAKKS